MKPNNPLHLDEMTAVLEPTGNERMWRIQGVFTIDGKRIVRTKTSMPPDAAVDGIVRYALQTAGHKVNGHMPSLTPIFDGKRYQYTVHFEGHPAQGTGKSPQWQEAMAYALLDGYQKLGGKR